MADAAQLHRLSCTRCKERKVRCNRIIPRCDRCTTHGVECVYPERAKRRPQRPAADRPSPDARPDPALNSILERLHRLEQQGLASPPSSAPDGHLASLRPSTTSPLSTLTPYPPAASLSDSPADAAAALPSEVDSTAVFKQAMDQVERLMLQSYATAVVTDEIDIPPELAKAWIENYFTHMATDMFLSLINKRLVQLIPDMVGLPHVHLDFSIQVLYYAVLFHGCTLNVSNTPTARGTDYAKTCYLGCLRALPGWRKEATGSTTDFVAALFMTRVAAECFDYDLVWKMHKLTGEFARALNLHNLDGGDYAGINDAARSDDDRRGFWQLIQTDLYIRLLLDKPPAVTADSWKVNLPWLNSQGPPEGVQPIAFLISSRVTMVLMRFFALLDDTSPRSKNELRRQTEALCHEIEQLYVDWQAHDMLATASKFSKEEDTWALTDCLLTGYTSIIFMLRKVDVADTGLSLTIGRDADLPASPRVVAASRHVVRIISNYFNIYAHPESLSIMLGAYAVHMPVACLYREVLRADDVRARTSDMDALEELAVHVGSLARGRREFYPLVRAVSALDAQVRKRRDEARAWLCP